MKDIQFREDRIHGSPDFLMQFYHVDRAHPRYEMTLHWHKEFEIVRVVSGELSLYTNNYGRHLAAGDIALINSGVMHRAEPREAVYECVVFDLNMLIRHGFDRIKSHILPILHSEVDLISDGAEQSEELCNAVSRLFSALRDESECYELMAYSAVFEIIYLIYSEKRMYLPNQKHTSVRQKENMTALIEWIENNYDSRVTLDTLSELVNLNKQYLCRIFKEYTGYSPIDFTNRLRVERAATQLSNGENNVTEAAFAVGFNDMSYFSKIFSRYIGMSPKKYLDSVKETRKK